MAEIDVEILTAIGSSGTHDCCLRSGWGRSENPADRKMDAFCTRWGGCMSDAMRDALNEEIRVLREARSRGGSPDGSARGLLHRARRRMETMDRGSYQKKPEEADQREAERRALGCTR